MNKYLSGIPEYIKEIVKAVIPLVVVVVLFLIIGKFGISKVSQIRGEIKDAGQKENILTSKLVVLKSFSEVDTNNLGLVTTALPGTNPVIILISQLKSIAAKYSVSLSEIKTAGSNSDSSSLPFILTNFQVMGTRSGIMLFLADIENIAPITQINRVRMSENLGTTSAEVATKTYWAPYPKTIPQVTEIVTDLSASEKKTIQSVSELIQPEFLNTDNLQGSLNENPFGQ